MKNKEHESSAAERKQMKRIVNSMEMKWLDSNTIDHFGIPSLVLMERAALSVVASMPPQLSQHSTVLVVCGNGNNGADGLAAARLLAQRGCSVIVAQMPDHGRRSKENQIQLHILEQYGIPVFDDIPNGRYACVLDALFGVGLSRAPQGVYADWIDRMNCLEGYKVAVDLPSGVSSDTGQVYDAAFLADLTITFAYAKIGQLLYPGRAACGQVKVADIGITDESWLKRRPSCFAPEKRDLCTIPQRPARSNKGTFGKVLVIAGSADMAGAALFSAKAAYQAGCGLVKICTPAENRAVLLGALPEAILSCYGAGGPDEKKLLSEIACADVVLLGPGIGMDDTAFRITETVLRSADQPLVIDADGLNQIAAHPDFLQYAKPSWILTPHPGEMARLTAKTIPQVLESLLETACAFAGQYKVTCVLKDAATVTAAADGTAYLNTSGCSAMAKGGSGDILSGIIASFLAQGMEPKQAAYMGVYVHGLAGEESAKKTGAYGLLARDLTAAAGRILDQAAQKARKDAIKTEQEI